MPPVRYLISAFAHIIFLVRHLLADFARLATLLCRSQGALAAENLFLRKQLALFQERKVKPHRATDATRFRMALLSRLFDWRSALIAVKPDTLIRWQGKGFGLFWRWKSKPRGRPKLPANLRELIREMAADNPIWGEARIAAELLLKLGIRVAPRTPVRAPKGDSYCERIVRTARRECLDFIILFSEKHLKRTLVEWVAHYNQGRPHKSLGPGIPVPLHPPPAPSERRHQIPEDCRVRAKPVLGGLHHEYSLEKLAA